MAREKRKDAIEAMRVEDDTYKEWLKYRDECDGETPVANRKASKKRKNSSASGMQSRVGRIENRMKEAHAEMDNLKKENRKLRKTLRSKSPHPPRRRKEASDYEEDEEEESEGGSDDSAEIDETEPMSSSEEERGQRCGACSKSRERARTASRRTAKEAKPKGRSQRMMSVQRTDSEGDDSFEEMGELAEDFASSEKLVAEIDQEFKELLDETRAAVLGKIDAIKKDGWNGGLV